MEKEVFVSQYAGMGLEPIPMLPGQQMQYAIVGFLNQFAHNPLQGLHMPHSCVACCREHVTVRLTPDGREVVGVYYSAHR